MNVYLSSANGTKNEGCIDTCSLLPIIRWTSLLILVSCSFVLVWYAKGNILNTIIAENSAYIDIIPRKQWLAKPPNEESKNLKTPVPYVILHNTGSNNCSGYQECLLLCLKIQEIHMNVLKLNDVGYNFLIGDDLVFEGRGFYKEGAHTDHYNNRSIGIGMIGSAYDWEIPKQQYRAAQQLIKHALYLHVLTDDYEPVVALRSNDNSSEKLLSLENGELNLLD